VQLLWRQPDLGCTCRFNNVFLVPDVDVVATAPPLERRATSVLESASTDSDAGSAPPASTDVRALLQSAIALPGQRTFTASLACDVRPGAATPAHLRAVREGLRALLPTAATRGAVLDSLRKEAPSVLDDPGLSVEALPGLVGEATAGALRASFGEPAVHAMAAAWGATSMMSSHVRHHLDRRAVAVSAAMLASQEAGGDERRAAGRSPGTRILAKRVRAMFQACPGPPEEYLLAYPELAVLIAGVFSADVCLTGIAEPAPHPVAVQ
jgi:hypothetical protein